ncbi:hypothetical protein CC86DRAFT_408514 [Ophiobolus disseminans]|uniref:S-protein homolog n=1 Tax=Ophiobolus disseminans TaxID=1469910 RepID=A0A6A6ZVQ1_9PLEO|nr:hypothetical protein CC86DRAFT_408514 [Ophiobolus disseminans]
MQLWFAFLLWATCVLGLATPKTSLDVLGEHHVESLQLVFHETPGARGGYFFTMWHGLRGIPVPACGAQDERFEKLGNQNGDSWFKISKIPWNGSESDCKYVNDGEGNLGQLLCGTEYVILTLTFHPRNSQIKAFRKNYWFIAEFKQDPGYHNKKDSCRFGNWKRAFYLEY